MFGLCSFSELPFSSFASFGNSNVIGIWSIELDNISIWIVEAP